jgi:hypothetical protein
MAASKRTLRINTMAQDVTRALLAGDQDSIDAMAAELGNAPVVSRRDAIKALNRMGDPYGEDEVADVMAGNAWIPTTTTEWARYFDNAV